MTYYIRLESRELTVGAVHAVSLSWLEKEATRSGRGLLDMIPLPGVTVYFDSGHATRPPEVRVHHRGFEYSLAGPVVFICWEASSSTEAVVAVTEVLEILPPQAQPGPFIHPLHPTRQ